MKEQIERMSRELESKRAGYREHFGVLESTQESVARTKRRVHDLAVELEKVHTKKREYESHLKHCLELLKSESAWRTAALSWMESDGALHVSIHIYLCQLLYQF
jgi:predicted  nucleic acid-binding Zn-ribbon protein